MVLLLLVGALALDPFALLSLPSYDLVADRERVELLSVSFELSSEPTRSCACSSSFRACSSSCWLFHDAIKSKFSGCEALLVDSLCLWTGKQN
eukprot:504255-Rhodomonas_salina.1